MYDKLNNDLTLDPLEEGKDLPLAKKIHLDGWLLKNLDENLPS